MKRLIKMAGTIFALFISLSTMISAHLAYGEMGTWDTLSPMPTPRWGAAAGVIDNKLYVAGGYNTISGSLAVLEAYDPETNTWETLQPMPTVRHGSGGAVIDGKLYVVGGEGKLNTLVVYDPASDTWATGPNMSVARSSPSVAAVDGMLYAAGGCQGWCAPVTSALEVFNPTNSTWSSKASMPVFGRAYSAVGVTNGLFYVMGGCCGWDSATSQEMAQTIQAYNPDTNTWSIMTDYLVGAGYTAGVINEKIYIAKIPDPEVYYPATDTWDTLPPMPAELHESSSGVINGKLYVVGGYTSGNQASSTLQVYIPDSDFDLVNDVLDAFPDDPAASMDTDGDGYPDEWSATATPEIIGASGLALDAFPDDPAASVDSDGDGYPDEWNPTATPEMIGASALVLDIFPNDLAASADSDGDGYPDEWNATAAPEVIAASGFFLDAFPNNPAASADSDGDGYPDEWNAMATPEIIGASGLVLDAFPDDPAASVDSDGDGYPDEWNTTATPEMIGTSGLVLDAFPDNPDAWLPANPEQPVQISPINADHLNTLTPLLVVAPYSDPYGDTHSMSHWQVSVSGSGIDFEQNLILDLESATNLTTFQMLDFMLQPNQTYYWRVRFINTNQYASSWSDVFAFSTPPNNEDNDGDGIEEAFELTYPIDLDDDGVDDNLQPDIKSFQTSIGNAQAGIKVGAGVISLLQVKPIDPNQLPEEGRPVDLPYGLFSFRLSVDPGAEAEVTIYVSRTLPRSMRWYKYEPANGWYDLSTNAVMNAVRSAVTLKLQDGGIGDADGVANGIIIDPSGPVGTIDSGGDSSGICFIGSLR